MFLLIDNYDSFTFNLVQAFQKNGQHPYVVKNDDPSLLQLATDHKVEAVCISPGPGRPENAGLCLQFLEQLPARVPVLGVCLGHQLLGHFAGASVLIAPEIMHGKSSRIRHSGTGLFSGLPQFMQVGRYHSLIVNAEESSLLEVTAHTDDNTIMAIQYVDRPWVGIQFHPESVLTPEGEQMLANFPQNIL